MIWNIPSIEHILSACLNYSLISLLKKHTHTNTHTHTRKYPCSVLCVFTQINACRRCTGSEFTHIYAIWFVHYENDKDLNFTHRLSPTPPLPLNRTCCVCMCVCVCMCARMCVCVCARTHMYKCVWAWPGSRALSGYTHTGRLRAITKAFQRNPQQVKIKCFRSNW